MQRPPSRAARGARRPPSRRGARRNGALRLTPPVTAHTHSCCRHTKVVTPVARIPVRMRAFVSSCTDAGYAPTSRRPGITQLLSSVVPASRAAGRCVAARQPADRCNDRVHAAAPPIRARLVKATRNDTRSGAATALCSARLTHKVLHLHLDDARQRRHVRYEGGDGLLAHARCRARHRARVCDPARPWAVDVVPTMKPLRRATGGRQIAVTP